MKPVTSHHPYGKGVAPGLKSGPAKLIRSI